MLSRAPISIRNNPCKHSGYTEWNHQYFLGTYNVLNPILGAFCGFIQNNIMKLPQLLSLFLEWGSWDTEEFLKTYLRPHS